MDDIRPQWNSGAMHKTFRGDHFLFIYISLLFFLLFPDNLEGQTRFSTLNHYTLVDGLPDNRVYSICFDSDRILWVGTAQGLVKFDGENFYNPTMPDDSVKLLRQQVTGISMDPGGDVWISNSKGIVRYSRQTNTFELVYPLNSTEDWATSILWSDKDTGWFLTQRKLVCVRASELQFEVYELRELILCL